MELSLFNEFDKNLTQLINFFFYRLNSDRRKCNQTSLLNNLVQFRTPIEFVLPHLQVLNKITLLLLEHF